VLAATAAAPILVLVTGRRAAAMRVAAAVAFLVLVPMLGRRATTAALVPILVAKKGKGEGYYMFYLMILIPVL